MYAVPIDAAAAGVAGTARVWRHAFVAVTAYFLWIAFLYRDAALGMVEIWSRSETFTHCFLILPITLWLIWRKRAQLATMLPEPNAGAFALMLLAGLGWLTGSLGTVNALTQFAFVALLVLGVPAILGRRIAAAIAFPLAFIFFSVPFGEFIMPQMMERTADFTVLALRASGIPVYREGLQFVIPSGNWSVVEACSGVRYLIASFTVGTLFAYFSYRSTIRRLLFIAVSIVVPVIANWLRAYMIVMLGHLSSNKLAVGVDHLIYGWVFFGIVIMIMFAIGARWSEDMTDDAAADSPEAVPPVEGARGAGRVYLASVLAALVATVPSFVESRIAGAESTVAVALSRPAAPAPWRIAGPPLSAMRPAFENPSADQHLTFTRGDEAVGLYLAYFRHQGIGRKMISSNSVLVASGDPLWAEVGRGWREVAFGGESIKVREVELRGSSLQSAPSERRWLVWQAYWIDGHWTASEGMAKVLTVWSRLRGKGDDSAIVLMYAPKGGQDAAALLGQFAAAAGPAIEAALSRTQALR